MPQVLPEDDSKKIGVALVPAVNVLEKSGPKCYRIAEAEIEAGVLGIIERHTHAGGYDVAG